MPELRSETMTVNMGPQHPSTHGVLNLVVQLSGETIIKADAAIGFLHTGIEKTAEQKKWQQVIPLVERMDYLGAQSNSLAFCLSSERLLGGDDRMPARVKEVRRRRSPSYEEGDLGEGDPGGGGNVQGRSNSIRARRSDGARDRRTLRRAKDFPVSWLRDLRLQDPDRDARRRLRPVSGAHRRDAREREDLPAGAGAHQPTRRLRHQGLPHRPATHGQGLYPDGSP